MYGSTYCSIGCSIGFTWTQTLGTQAWLGLKRWWHEYNTSSCTCMCCVVSQNTALFSSTCIISVSVSRSSSFYILDLSSVLFHPLCILLICYITSQLVSFFAFYFSVLIYYVSSLSLIFIFLSLICQVATKF